MTDPYLRSIELGLMVPSPEVPHQNGSDCPCLLCFPGHLNPFSDQTPKRRPGRPATGVTPTRSVRVGDVWDQAATVAKARGESLAKVIERALTEYVGDPE